MSHSRVERIENIVELANNFKNKSDQSLKSSKKFKQKLKEEMEKEDEEKLDKKESYQDMIDRLFFEEQTK